MRFRQFSFISLYETWRVYDLRIPFTNFINSEETLEKNEHMFDVIRLRA